MIAALTRLARFALSLLTGSFWHWPLAALRWIIATPARLFLILAVAMAVVAWSEHRSAAQWHAQAVKVTQTLTAERRAAQVARLAYQAQSRKDAKDADTNHTALAAGGDRRFSAYAADHGLREIAPAHRPRTAQADAPAVLENPSPDAIMAEISRVWITRSDWLSCDADFAYAMAAYGWGKKTGSD